MILTDDFYGDKFRWFVGIVQDVADDRSRVRVRIFGIHHMDDQEKIPNDFLPWAMVIYPTTGGQTSSGNASHGLKVGSWVIGFFVDGEDSQQPMVLGVINGGQGSLDNSPRNSRDSGGPPSVSNPTSTENAYNFQPTTQLTGPDNKSKVYNYFWEKLSEQNSVTGDIKSICAALVGNFQIESGDNINPQAYNGSDRGEISMGIAQWRGGKYDRITPFLKFCGISSMVKPPNLPPLEQQLDYVWYEFNNSEKPAFHYLLTADNVADAVAGMIKYERDASYVRGQVDRSSPYYLKKLQKAKAIYSSLSYTGNVK